MRTPGWLVVVVVVACIGLGIAPAADRLTWFLENLPVFIGLPVFITMHRRQPLTPLVCWLLAGHAIILMIGGFYTYEAVPAGNWVRDALHLDRNPYDRFGHLAQGFVPAILVREVLLRRGLAVRGLFWATIITLSCLGFSALFEIFEWRSAVAFGGGADAYLGSQGDPWDAQWDMACCGMGAMLALATLGRLHQRQYRPATEGLQPGKESTDARR
jgi:putative membrane protein